MNFPQTNCVIGESLSSGEALWDDTLRQREQNYPANLATLTQYYIHAALATPQEPLVGSNNYGSEIDSLEKTLEDNNLVIQNKWRGGGFNLPCIF